MNIQNFIYLNSGERYKDMIDHCRYISALKEQ